MTLTEVGTQVSKPPIVILRERLEARAQELEAALPDDIEPRQFIRAAMTSAALNPDILATSWQSFWNACLRACRDGLLPDGVEGAIVPYKDKANWIAMYQGLLRRFRRSGQFKWVAADLVREGDKFEHWRDEGGEHFKHVPAHSDRPIVSTYACALTKEGAFFVAVLSNTEIDKIKRMSKATRDDAPWRLWEDEMRKKSALRRLIKLLPTARDVIPPDDDDDEPPDIQMPTIEHQPIAPRSAAAALDQFAASATGPTESMENSPDPHGPVGEQGAGTSIQAADEDSAALGSDSTATRDPAAAHDEQLSELLDAYVRGKNAKAAGHQRKAMPGEFRELSRQREAICWSAGYDGKPLPQFSDPPQ